MTRIVPFRCDECHRELELGSGGRLQPLPTRALCLAPAWLGVLTRVVRTSASLSAMPNESRESFAAPVGSHRMGQLGAPNQLGQEGPSHIAVPVSVPDTATYATLCAKNRCPLIVTIMRTRPLSRPKYDFLR
jgi:hypothetical protein